MHVSKGKPSKNSTKVWLTKAGGCILANNLGCIPNNELNKILEIIALNYFRIVAKWEQTQKSELKFYC